jgi:hypothetical protein
VPPERAKQEGVRLFTGHFVGRADELGSLEGILDELDRGCPGAIEVAGEPGIGKTRLLKELAARAGARGYLVLSGAASEFEHDLPFSVFVDALDEYVAGLEPDRLAVLDGAVQAELAHVFPSLSALAAGREVALQSERYRSHRAVRELLKRLAAPAPLVLVLDDVHWADSASAELLGALLRRPPAAAVLVAVALRPRQLPERLSAALERAHRAAALTRIELGALTPVEARAFLGGTVDAAEAIFVYEESGGNPFYLEQLARSLKRAGTVTLMSETSLTGLGVPPPVAAALSEELALLSEDTRLVLQSAAVAGDPFEPELAAAAAATSEAAAMDAVDELQQLDLVHPTDVPRRFRFRHPLVRRAVYEAAPGGWRLGAHERCAEALATRGAAAVARAHHIERFARVGDLAAVAVLCEAGEQAARLAPATAARWFGDALRLLRQTAPSEQRVTLLLARAAALTATGQFAASHEALLEGLALVPDESIAPHIILTTACVRVEHRLGQYEQAHGRLVSELGGLPEPVSAEAVDLLIELALNEFYRSKYHSMYGWAQRAVSAARALGDAPLTAAALAMPALACAMTGEGGPAQGCRAGAASLVDSLCDSELSRRLDAAAWLAAAELYLDRYAEADAPWLSRARRGKRSSSLSCTRSWAGPGTCAASWTRPPSSSTARSRRHGCWARRRLWRGTCSTAPSSRSPPATSTPLWPPHRRVPTSRATSTKASSQPGRPQGSPGSSLRLGNLTVPPGCSSAARAARSRPSSPVAGGPTALSCSRVAGSRSTAAAKPSAQPPAPRPQPRPCSFPSPPPGPTAPPPPWPCTPATPPTQPSGGSPPPPPLTKPAPPSRQRCHR